MEEEINMQTNTGALPDESDKVKKILEESVQAVVDAHGKEVKDIKKRAELIQRANNKIFAANKKLFNESSAAFEEHADITSTFVLAADADISEQLKKELDKLAEISQEAVFAPFERLKELRDESELIMNNIEALEEVGVRGADAGLKLAQDQGKMLKESTKFWTGIKDSLKTGLKEGLKEKISGISLGPVPIGRMLMDKFGGGSDRKKAAAMSRLETLRTQKSEVRDSVKSVSDRASETFTEKASEAFEGAGETLDSFMKISGEILEILKDIHENSPLDEPKVSVSKKPGRATTATLSEVLQKQSSDTITAEQKQSSDSLSEVLQKQSSDTITVEPTTLLSEISQHTSAALLDDSFIRISGEILEILKAIHKDSNLVANTTVINKGRAEEDRREEKEKHHDLLEVLSDLKGNASMLSGADGKDGAGGGGLINSVLEALGLKSLIMGGGKGGGGRIARTLKAIKGKRGLGAILAGGAALFTSNKGAAAKAAKVGGASVVGSGAAAAKGASVVNAAGVAKGGAAAAKGIGKMAAMKAIPRLMLRAISIPFMSMASGFIEAGQEFRKSGDVAEASKAYLKGMTKFLTLGLVSDETLDKIIQGTLDVIHNSIANIFSFITDIFSWENIKPVLRKLNPALDAWFKLFDDPDEGTPEENGMKAAVSNKGVKKAFMGIGKDEITDIDKIQDLNSNQIRELLDEGNWSDTDRSNLEAALRIQEKRENPPKATVVDSPTDGAQDDGVDSPGFFQKMRNWIPFIGDSEEADELSQVNGDVLSTEVMQGNKQVGQLYSADAEVKIQKKREQQELQNLITKTATSSKNNTVVDARSTKSSTTVMVGDSIYNNDPSYTRHENRNMVPQ